MIKLEPIHKARLLMLAAIVEQGSITETENLLMCAFSYLFILFDLPSLFN